MTDRYVELHSASGFSFLEGASQPEELIKRSVELEMPAMALLDRNGVYGSARFYTSAKRVGARAHIGAEIATLGFGSRLTPPAWLPHQHQDEPVRLSLLCESRIGYQNLCQLTTQFKMRETKKGEGAAKWDDIQQYAYGLVCLTGGEEGPLASALASGGEDAGREAVEKLVSVFGRESVYVEIQRHHEREEEWRNQAALRIARSLNFLFSPQTASGTRRPMTARCSTSSLAIRHHVELDRAGRLLGTNNQRHMRPAHEMASALSRCSIRGRKHG
jgi:error-prone DNA polymerase